MKKLLLLCTCVLFIGIETSNAQSEPGKKETFNFIVDLIEGACDFDANRIFKVVSKDDDNFTLRIKAEGTVNGNISYVQNYFLEFKSLDFGSIDNSRGSYSIYFNKIIKKDIRYSNGRNGDFSSEEDLIIDLCDTEKSKRMDKAINHFLKLMKGEGSFFDD